MGAVGAVGLRAARGQLAAKCIFLVCSKYSWNKQGICTDLGQPGSRGTPTVSAGQRWSALVSAGQRAAGKLVGKLAGSSRPAPATPSDAHVPCLFQTRPVRNAKFPESFWNMRSPPPVSPRVQVRAVAAWTWSSCSGTDQTVAGARRRLGPPWPPARAASAGTTRRKRTRRWSTRLARGLVST